MFFLLTSPVYRQWSTGFVICVELAEDLSLRRSRGLWMCKTWSSVCDGEEDELGPSLLRWAFKLYYSGGKESRLPPSFWKRLIPPSRREGEQDRPEGEEIFTQGSPGWELAPRPQETAPSLGRGTHTVLRVTFSPPLDTRSPYLAKSTCPRREARDGEMRVTWLRVPRGHPRREIPEDRRNLPRQKTEDSSSIKVLRGRRDARGTSLGDAKLVERFLKKIIKKEKKKKPHASVYPRLKSRLK